MHTETAKVVCLYLTVVVVLVVMENMFEMTVREQQSTQPTLKIITRVHTGIRFTPFHSGSHSDITSSSVEVTCQAWLAFPG